MCYWKQWPRCRTRVKNLVRLGCPLDAAISVGMSRKGPWHLSRTYATQLAMSNEWLVKQGLISIKDAWVRSITRLRPGNFCEPPGARPKEVPVVDPHAGWCGGWGRKTPGYPISLFD